MPIGTHSKRWTPKRQVSFLSELAITGSVTAAASAAGMSRESAHRLRNRPNAELFAALWDLALEPVPADPSQGHNRSLGDGALLRLLGNHFRRQCGNFGAIRTDGSLPETGDRTRTS